MRGITRCTPPLKIPCFSFELAEMFFQTSFSRLFLHEYCVYFVGWVTWVIWLSGLCLLHLYGLITD
jgi:hypothetical protein